jgi:hypothetical protein
MAAKIRNNTNNGWQNVATIKVRNNANNGWHTVNTGKIWTGSAWSRFYQRITTTAPIVSATTVTKNAITWTVTQASTLQFAEFPSQFQYYIIYPSGLRSPSTGYSYTDARVSTISLTGLSQNQTVSLYYRLRYEDDTPGDDNDNVYYPEDETYQLKQTTTIATVVENPTVYGNGSAAPNSVSFFVNYNEADSFNWYLYRTSDSQFIDDGARTFTGNQGTFSIPVPYHDTNYRLYVRANYETDFASNEYTYATGYQTSDAVVAVAPGVVGTALDSYRISWDIDFNGANYVMWTLIRVSTGSIIDSGTVYSAGALITSGLLSNTQYRLKADGVFTDYGAFEVATTNAYETTEVFVPTAPTITYTGRGYNYVNWTITSGLTIEYQVGTSSGGSNILSGFSAGGLAINADDLTISTSQIAYYIRSRSYAATGEVSAWVYDGPRYTAALVNPVVTFGSQGTSPFGKTLTWNISNGSGTDISFDLRRGSTQVDTGTTSSSTYSYAPVTTGQTYTLFYRSRIQGDPDFWAPTYAVGSYVNWPGVSRTVT